MRLFWLISGYFTIVYFTNGHIKYTMNGRPPSLYRPITTIHLIILFAIFYQLLLAYPFSIHIYLLRGCGLRGQRWGHCRITVAIICLPFLHLNNMISIIWNLPNVLVFGVRSTISIEPTFLFVLALQIRTRKILRRKQIMIKLHNVIVPSFLRIIDFAWNILCFKRDNHATTVI